MSTVNAQINKLNSKTLLSYSTGGFPNDYWMPAIEIASPEFSKQVSLGMNIDFMKNTYALSLVAYRKTMENLVAFKDGASMYGNFDRWENVVETGGSGTSKGI